MRGLTVEQLSALPIKQLAAADAQLHCGPPATMSGGTVGVVMLRRLASFAAVVRWSHPLNDPSLDLARP
jgi:hypothetical protein